MRTIRNIAIAALLAGAVIVLNTEPAAAQWAGCSQQRSQCEAQAGCGYIEDDPCWLQDPDQWTCSGTWKVEKSYCQHPLLGTVTEGWCNTGSQPGICSQEPPVCTENEPCSPGQPALE